MFLICGEALFDVFVKPQQSINSLHFEAHAGGSPFNVAIGISRLGGHCALLGGVSNDLLGQRLEDILRTEGVNCDYLVHADLPTPLSLVGNDEHGQPSYSFYSSETADRSIVQSKLPNLTQAIHAQAIHGLASFPRSGVGMRMSVIRLTLRCLFISVCS